MFLFVIQPPPGPPPLSNGVVPTTADSNAGPSRQEVEPPHVTPVSHPPPSQPPAATPSAAPEEPLPHGWEMRHDVYGRRYY